MFGPQAKQLTSLVPPNSAREILACLANPKASLRHSGPIGMAATSKVAPKAFQRPPGRTQHVSVTRSKPVLKAPPKPPLWKDLPGRPKEGQVDSTQLTVPGGCRLGRTQAETLYTKEAKSDSLSVEDELVNEGTLEQRGEAVFHSPVLSRKLMEILGDLVVEQSLTVRGPVDNKGIVNNWGPVIHNGPVVQNGPIKVAGQEMTLVPIDVVTDVIYDGNKLQKITRKIMSAAAPGVEILSTVVDCA